MKLLRNKQFRRIAPFIVSIILIGVLLSYTPPHKIAQAFQRFDENYAVLLILLSATYYSLKTVRFWYLLQAINIQKPFKPVSLSYMSAQPASLLPAGEIFRSHALERFTGVPIKTSIAQFTIQGILEGVSMATLAVISALALHTLRIPMLIFLGTLLVIIVIISRGYIAHLIHALNQLPLINLNVARIVQFSEKNRAILTWHWLPFLFTMSVLIEMTGAAIAYVAVLGIGGHIDGYQAVLLYVVPLVSGFVSFLPGGVGVSEQAAVGVLLLSHVSVADAVAATLIMRLTIVGLGVVYGVIIGVIGKIYLQKQTVPITA